MFGCQRRGNYNQVDYPNPNEVLHENSLLYLLQTFHAWLLPQSPWPPPGKCRCWCYLVSQLVSIVQCPRQKFPQSSVYTECNGKGFVDKTTLWETSKNDTIKMVVTRMEAKAQSWECKIHASDGSLNLLKKFWYAISWKWRKSSQPAMQMKTDDPELEMHMTQHANQDNAKAVKCIKVTQGKQTLGL